MYRCKSRRSRSKQPRKTCLRARRYANLWCSLRQFIWNCCEFFHQAQKKMWSTSMGWNQKINKSQRWRRRSYLFLWFIMDRYICWEPQLCWTIWYASYFYAFSKVILVFSCSFQVMKIAKQIGCTVHKTNMRQMFNSECLNSMNHRKLNAVKLTTFPFPLKQ